MKSAVLGLLLSVTTMVVIGIVMLFSTSAFSRDAFKVKKTKPKTEAAANAAAAKQPGVKKDAAKTETAGEAAPEKEWDPASLVKRQALWLGIALVVCIGAALVDYRFWQKTWPYWFGIAVVLLVACFLFKDIKGSHRWIRLGAFTFQPSELGKLAAIIFLAAWLHRYEQARREFLKGLLFPLMGVGVFMGLIAPEVDLGTTAILGCTALAMIFVGGASLWQLLPLPVLGLAGILGAAICIPNRLGRMMAFLDLEKYKDGAGNQQWNGLIALGSGGTDGLGLGLGRQKFMYLPEAHTDFIFPTIGEELGLIFTLLIVFCYVVMIVSGIAISLNARDRFGMLLGTGITVIIALQSALNIGVTTALLPNKGIPLPFISYGGSNLLFCMLGVGILLNIYRNGAEPVVRAATRPRNLLTPRI